MRACPQTFPFAHLSPHKSGPTCQSHHLLSSRRSENETAAEPRHFVASFLKAENSRERGKKVVF